MSPPILHMQFHLHGLHMVAYNSTNSLSDVVQSEKSQRCNWESCHHMSINGGASLDTNNRFATLQPEAPAPRSDDVRQELCRLQDQVSRLGRRLQDYEAPGCALMRTRGRREHLLPSHHPQHQRQTLAPRCRSSPPHAFQRRATALPP